MAKKNGLAILYIHGLQNDLSINLAAWPVGRKYPVFLFCENAGIEIQIPVNHQRLFYFR
jgi:hypothetical protein